MRMLRSSVLFLLVALGQVSMALADFEEDYETKKWQEMEVQLPVAPKQETLLPFYVSAATSNRFYIDGATLSVGSDGVVRYVLVILSAEGGAMSLLRACAANRGAPNLCLRPVGWFMVEVAQERVGAHPGRLCQPAPRRALPRLFLSRRSDRQQCR